MGFFSWMTQDTGKSISNRFTSRGTFPVVMVDNNNNQWVEEDYEGYGVFGGKDYYELLAEMNGLTTRDEGIDLQYSSGIPFITPNLIEQSSASTWEWVDECPEDCDDQGYFYYDEEDDDEN